MKILQIIFSLVLASYVFATYGLDMSIYQGDPALSDFQCLKKDGYDFAILQAQTSNGGYNPYVKSQFEKCHQAEINYVDVYIFPDVSKDAASQIHTTVSKAIGDGVLTGKNMIWLDIEPYKWSSNHQTNIDFIAAMISECEKVYNIKPGIYSNWNSWSEITGGTTRFSSYQIWYPHYDGSASFSDFEPFGGWSKPNIKQFQGTTSICGTEIDKDFY
ncbi:lysozyme protein [Anaeramoeba ignava]|uniref:Lysozyme protein n=1 Tax=Anaeramoeba ignava TaxID=1746090 RepID=A0A9Q0LIL9_ANAIG|nr:lysozyme protein [Anaeramoeba ignava]|eukprot:Anaeramoba_ignava/a218256_357.p1 GENE.a218256_357~~a218256_357.p1  ORF type:complete len:216 (-),score=62.12 a218256_357:286-933(-)